MNCTSLTCGSEPRAISWSLRMPSPSASAVAITAIGGVEPVVEFLPVGEPVAV